jgi:DNA repair protein RecN (Recombination protein N)
LLLELKVRNFGIIEEMHWRVNRGLNAVTGETGAGKSLVVDAVDALLAGKAGTEVIRHGADAAVVEGVFDLSGGAYVLLKDFLAENGLDDDESLIIRYEVGRRRRGTVRLNGSAATRSVLRRIGEMLVDIHGQSEHLSLLDRRKQLDILDGYAHALPLRRRFRNAAEKLAAAEKELAALLGREKEGARQQEFLRFQIAEIEEAGLREGEEAELEQERSVLLSGEKLKELSFAAYQALGGEEAAGYSARDRLGEAVRLLKELAELDATRQAQRAYLEEAFYGVEDAARTLRAYHDSLESNPARLEQVETRLELIRALKRKYGDTITGILAFCAEARRQLEGITHSAEKKHELAELRAGIRAEMGQLAAELSRARARAAEVLAAAVQRELADLNMAGVSFAVAIARREDAGGIPFPDGKIYAFHEGGADSAEFLAATNPGEPQKPLAQIASTGEISRFMLALKSALSGADNIPVLIFDEIDIGVGGRSGEVIGRKLWALARDRQVICVTHLPQIAAFADRHYCVRKEVAGERTRSLLETLEGEARERELAVMLAGADYTPSSRESALELLAKAENWKKSAAGKPR